VTGNDLPPLSKVSERPHFRKYVTDFKRLALIPASLANATGGAYSFDFSRSRNDVRRAGSSARRRELRAQIKQTIQSPWALKLIGNATA
jgi:hypothetical protein